MKWNSSLLIVTRFMWILILSLALLGCGQSDPIEIGFVGALSGRRSQLGVSGRNGAILAVEKINQSGGIRGRQIQLLVRDNQGDEGACARVVDELVQKGVCAIIGPLMSKMAPTVINQTAGKNVLVISPTVSTESLEGIEDFFLRVMPVARNEAEAIADIVVRNHHRKLAVVYDSRNAEYTETILRHFVKEIEAVGLEIVYANPLVAGQDERFIPIAREIVDAKADGLLMITSSIDAAFLCQQLRILGSEIKIYGGHWVKTGNLIEEGGHRVEGLTLVSPYERAEKSSEYLAFRKAYQTYFMKNPEFVSVFSYEAAMVLFEGIQNSETLDAQDVRNAILQRSMFEGLEESFRIDRYGDAIRENLILTIKNGRFVRIEE